MRASVVPLCNTGSEVGSERRRSLPQRVFETPVHEASVPDHQMFAVGRRLDPP